MPCAVRYGKKFYFVHILDESLGSACGVDLMPIDIGIADSLLCHRGVAEVPME
jgi:hypothetical protein